MSLGRFLLVPLALALISPAIAKDRNKPAPLPAEILKAQTVAVVVDPDAGMSLSDPGANRTAQDDVEKALMKWGRYRPVMDIQSADFIISVRRRSKSVTPSIGGPNVNDRPVVLQPGETETRIGISHGDPRTIGGTGTPTQRSTIGDQRPMPRTEVGPAEDVFEVYLAGGREYPLDSAPIWRYAAKNALDSPRVPAVERFHEAVNEADKQAQASKKP